ncbi:translin-associated factor X-interacting protein 1 isoform X2 [Cheilinus undulatus]|uniref:translin-associated factor X-interacting protein 1 isoform X2 n=1 Tax=Cheilinus undulatus TaxID=241271 RepID=UPI001BD2F902|nr:translin-associated factor X-interacting protein 1 isoform X2 [Cheilinus undulatus]
MSLDSEIKFPPQTHPQKKSTQTYCVQSSEEEKDVENAEAQSVQLAAKKLSWMDTSYIYVSSERKPLLLIQLESYLNNELQTISFHQPKFQELKLQVYRNIFGHLIKEFKTYQSLLSAIKKEYENTLECQQDQIQKLEPLQSRLRLVTEECDRKIQDRLEEEQAVIGALKRENQQLQKDLEAMRAKEKAMQRVVDQLQAEVSNQYLQYREERDARKLLMWQLNDLTGDSVKKEDPAEINTEENKDTLELQLTLKMCRKDLTKAQEELVKMKMDHWDMVPRCKWDTLTQTHTQTLLQLKTLQGDFDQLKSWN